MELQEIRNEINKIDDAMHDLFDARMACSKEVAKTKLRTQDSIFKPQREKEVMARFSGEEQRMYRLYVRKVMQLSRFYQYREFIFAGQKDDGFAEAYGKAEKEAGAGGDIRVTLETDPASERAISVQEVLSLLGDFCLTMKSLRVEDTKVSFTIGLSQDEATCQNTELLLYMLYKESIRCEFSMFVPTSD